MKVAIIHYWLVGMRGGERVLEQICQLYPDADIYTHVANPGALSDVIRAHKISETFISRLPKARKLYQKYLPLMPRALEALDLQEYDLIISSESGPAKGVITRPDALHVCYCHSPMRYIWDLYGEYKSNAGWLTRFVMPELAHRLRIWDTTSAARVDHIIANSHFVARRISKSWGREASVIHPPVDVDSFLPSRNSSGYKFYLYAGELVSYKRPDLVVDAFNGSSLKLVVIGDGPERARLEKSSGDNITFLGRVPFYTLREYYANCRALIFPGVEDFGIVPLEVMASGRPVLAFSGGGALETVVDGVTGTFFHKATKISLLEGLERLEAIIDSLDSDEIRRHALTFHPEKFRSSFKAAVDEVISEKMKAIPQRHKS